MRRARNNHAGGRERRLAALLPVGRNRKHQNFVCDAFYSDEAVEIISTSSSERGSCLVTSSSRCLGNPSPLAYRVDRSDGVCMCCLTTQAESYSPQWTQGIKPCCLTVQTANPPITVVGTPVGFETFSNSTFGFVLVPTSWRLCFLWALHFVFRRKCSEIQAGDALK